MKRTYSINSEQEKREIAQRIHDAPFKAPFKITASFEDDRTNEQNNKMWAALRDISRQAMWCEQKLTPEDWKHLFTAAVLHQKVFNGLEGGLVMVSRSTSSMRKSELSELIEYIIAWGVDHDVEFGDDHGT